MVIPNALKDTVLETFHLALARTDPMHDIVEYIWLPHIQRAIVTMYQQCKESREQSKNFKSVKGEKNQAILDKVVKPNDEIQVDFAGWMTDELNEDAYILVANDSY